VAIALFLSLAARIPRVAVCENGGYVRRKLW